jgi:hypothetical protein
VMIVMLAPVPPYAWHKYVLRIHPRRIVSKHGRLEQNSLFGSGRGPVCRAVRLPLDAALPALPLASTAHVMAIFISLA